MHRILPFLFLGWLVLSALPAPAQSSGFSTLNPNREGGATEVKDFARRGKLNIMVFTSRHCPFCRRLEPLLRELARGRNDLLIGRLALDRPQAREVDWQSPLARQYQLRSVPYFMVFDERGELVEQGYEARRRVNRMLREADLL